MVAKDKTSKPVNTPNVVVKSPSDTTIYVPVLKLLSPKPPSSNSHELPKEEGVDNVTNQELVNKISEFIEGMRMEQSSCASDGQDQRGHQSTSTG